MSPSANSLPRTEEAPALLWRQTEASRRLPSLACRGHAVISKRAALTHRLLFKKHSEKIVGNCQRFMKAP